MSYEEQFRSAHVWLKLIPPPCVSLCFSLSLSLFPPLTPSFLSVQLLFIICFFFTEYFSLQSTSTRGEQCHYCFYVVFSSGVSAGWALYLHRKMTLFLGLQSSPRFPTASDTGRGVTWVPNEPRAALSVSLYSWGFSIVLSSEAR